jgi:hypothetical protein
MTASDNHSSAGSDDLVARCKEVLDWHRTGLLNGGTGGQLRALAAQIEASGMPDHYALTLAEKQTADEAMKLVVSGGAAQAVSEPVAWKSTGPNHQGLWWEKPDLGDQYKVQPLYAAQPPADPVDTSARSDGKTIGEFYGDPGARCSAGTIEAALRDAFPHFQSEEPITPEAIRDIGKEYLDMVMSWEPHKDEIEFADHNGTIRKIVYEPGDYEVGINPGWVLEDDTLDQPQEAWKCFHCSETFTDPEAAKVHFGEELGSTPGCKLNALEGGLLKIVRDQEEELRQFRREEMASYREFYSLGADHSLALVREEQKGYDKGLADARAEAEQIVRSAPSLDENGYICEKAAILSALPGSAVTRPHQRGDQ